MYARVTEITGQTDEVDEAIARFRDQVVPGAQSQAGFDRIYLLVDRESGKALSISVWDTEDAMRASDATAQQLRSQTLAGTSGSVSSVGYYEIAVAEPSD